MRPLILLSAILIPFLYAQDWCCPRKNVGGKVYNLVSSDVDGSKWGCSDNCAYAMEGDMNMTRKFCFRPGKFESKCDSDFTGMPGGGSMGTGMPGGGGMTTGMPGGGGMTGGAGGSGCRCGVKKTSRIVGGTEVDPKNKYPWMVALMDGTGSSQFCGGTLVASKYVVTAAHCMFFDQNAQQPLTTAQVKVRIGDHDLAATGETSIAEKTIAVSKITNHPSYAPAGGSLNNDITVLELAEAVDLNVYTPACLAQTSDEATFYGKTAQVYGWGTTSSGGAASSKLLEVDVPVVTPTQCATSMGPMEGGQICAGGVSGKDSCQGDSGGPLSYESNGQHILIGDVSYGDGCAKEGFYGVYGRVSFYRSWIDQQMTGATFCPSGANAGA